MARRIGNGPLVRTQSPIQYLLKYEMCLRNFSTECRRLDNNIIVGGNQRLSAKSLAQLAANAVLKNHGVILDPFARLSAATAADPGTRTVHCPFPRHTYSPSGEYAK